MSSNAATTEKWTEVEHLPKWDEEFYEVWTGKKHGKWVMMKTLRPEYAEQEEYRQMMEREFDARYNLSHPNIVMINDYEEVPGVGLCIVTDDVYGKSLRELIDAKAVTRHHLDQLRRRLPAAMQYIQENHLAHHPIRPERIIFTENIENLKLIDVGFEQRENLSPKDASEDIAAYGHVVLEALGGLKEGERGSHTMKRVAERAVHATPEHNPYRSIPLMQSALERRNSDLVYWLVIAFLAVMVGILLWLTIAAPKVSENLEKYEPSAAMLVN